ncbi:hypothetical protein NPA31_011855 [Aurantimonas sp. MSK8Z-1]|uniref:hypothetical protein n=1 Tax=Mangrovibrevibacter kandeliae TaxID=2968473 RepID=UPI002119A0CA|nr:hypothetical protein [Aurantimonas sp. MSK8Z-1]MCW4115658.1 hypothetical protein [Aurantimonas sp. MSK8Z-1]
MANPNKYAPDHVFPDNPAFFPAFDLNDQLNKVSQATDEAVKAIQDVRRSDGRLVNELVTLDSLHPSVRAGLGDGVLVRQELVDARDQTVSATATAVDAASAAAAAAGSATDDADRAESARTGAEAAAAAVPAVAGQPRGRIVRSTGADGAAYDPEATGVQNVLENSSFSWRPRGDNSPSTTSAFIRWGPPIGGGPGYEATYDQQFFPVDPQYIPDAIKPRNIRNRPMGMRLNWTGIPSFTTPSEPGNWPDTPWPMRFTCWEHFGNRNPVWQNGKRAHTRVLVRRDGSRPGLEGIRVGSLVSISDLNATLTPYSAPPPTAGNHQVIRNGYVLLPGKNELVLTGQWQALDNFFDIPYRGNVDPNAGTAFNLDLLAWPAAGFGIELCFPQMNAGDFLHEYDDFGSMEALRAQQFLKRFGVGLTGTVVYVSGTTGIIELAYQVQNPGPYNNLVAPLLATNYVAIRSAGYDYTSADLSIQSHSINPTGGFVQLSGTWNNQLPPIGSLVTVRATGLVTADLFYLQLA